eukprot:scaffold160150_cov16-Prasinocladus_malaysianus.AAC.2
MEKMIPVQRPTVLQTDANCGLPPPFQDGSEGYEAASSCFKKYEERLRQRRDNPDETPDDVWLRSLDKPDLRRSALAERVRRLIRKGVDRAGLGTGYRQDPAGPPARGISSGLTERSRLSALSTAERQQKPLWPVEGFCFRRLRQCQPLWQCLTYILFIRTKTEPWKRS